MTKQELRALDVRIHREVMGETCRWSESHQDWLIDLDWMRNMDGSSVSVAMPEYSAKMADAWNVVEKLTEGRYVKVRCEQSHYHGDYCSIVAADDSQRNGTELVKRDVIGVWGETMPLAICRAAIKAIEPQSSSQAHAAPFAGILAGVTARDMFPGVTTQ